MVTSNRQRSLIDLFTSHRLSSALDRNLPATSAATQINNVFTSFSVESSGSYMSISPSPHLPLYLRF
ncbi:unnamed protein product [Absidia cylindrospora]